jgi:hypothetical protein
MTKNEFAPVEFSGLESFWRKLAIRPEVYRCPGRGKTQAS